MPHITVLDENTINKIAAGEVIERPASVVKELLENAIDAQASAVTVEIRDGGISYIRVTDNGCGIPEDEVKAAFLRHSTSKISSADDLFMISSLGFRGEALASIAAVSQVEVITKTPDEISGTRYVIEGGKERIIEEIGAPDGTTVIVRNLFYNTPARKKFLKTPQTEASHVSSLVEKIAMSRPGVSVRFIQNNQNKLHTSGNHNFKDIIYTIFGRETASDVIPVNAQDEILQIDGYIGRPVLARSNRNFENYFVNGRYVKNNVIAKAVEDAYKPFMMQHKYPFILLQLYLEPEYLDVNVHPAKMEVRFRNSDEIYELLYNAISSALSQQELIVKVEEADREPAEKEDRHKNMPHLEPFEVKRSKIEDENRSGIDIYSDDDRQTERSYQNIAERMADWGDDKTGSVDKVNKKENITDKPEQLDMFEERFLEPESREKHKLIGQVFDTYWIVEFGDNMYIIDQHAAHEKVLYERTLKSLKTREYTSQNIDPPVILTLSSSEAELLEQNIHYFTDIGFQIEPFGGREYAVRAVPDNLFSIAKRDLLMEMIDSLTEETFSGDTDTVYERIASMSCKAAVKGNHQMSAQEADELIDELLGLDNPYACPHGRPTIISMSKRELEKKFKRIV